MDAALFAALARLDNREERAAPDWASAARNSPRASDARLLLSMHERFGDDGVARCLGAFAFALWDAETRRLTLGRDCLGNRALFYHRGPHFVAFATSLRACWRCLACRARSTSWRWRNSSPSITANSSARSIAASSGFRAGRMVSIDRNGMRSRKYWTPDFDAPPPYRREEDYIERARELLDLAVASATRDTPHVAIATSGGLDSSAIAATAARLGTAESITCFSMVPPPGTQIDVGPFRYLDERDKVEALARMHPSLAVRFVTPERDDPWTEDDTRYFARANLPALGSGRMGIGRHLTDAIRGRRAPGGADRKLRRFRIVLAGTAFSGRSASRRAIEHLRA